MIGGSVVFSATAEIQGVFVLAQFEVPAIFFSIASSRAKPLFRRSEGSRVQWRGDTREIPPPAGESAGIRDDASVEKNHTETLPEV